MCPGLWHWLSERCCFISTSQFRAQDVTWGWGRVHSRSAGWRPRLIVAVDWLIHPSKVGRWPAGLPGKCKKRKSYLHHFTGCPTNQSYLRIYGISITHFYARFIFYVHFQHASCATYWGRGDWGGVGECRLLVHLKWSRHGDGGDVDGSATWICERMDTL